MRNTVKIRLGPSAQGSMTRGVIQYVEVNGAEISNVTAITERDYGLSKEVTITFLVEDLEVLYVEPTE